METKYFVVRCYRYKASGNWEYSLVGMYATLSAAKQAFHAALGSIIKDSNDFASAILFDSFGNKYESDFDDTHVDPEPEPNAEPTA